MPTADVEQQNANRSIPRCRHLARCFGGGQGFEQDDHEPAVLFPDRIHGLEHALVFVSAGIGTLLAAPITLKPDSVLVVGGSNCLELPPEDRAAFFRFSMG